jgi:hypothetical protein
MENWISYIIENNPEGVNDIIAQYGFMPVETKEELYDAVDYLRTEYGVKATEDLMSVHPDYDVIVEHYLAENKPEDNQVYSNANELPEQTPSIESCQQINYANNSNILFSSNMKDVLLLVCAFWLVKTIIKS